MVEDDTRDSIFATGDSQQTLRSRRHSIEGGQEPVWSRSRVELFYRRGLTWIGVRVGTGETFEAKESSATMSGMYVNPPGRSYDVLPDGSFLVLERLDANTRLTEIRVVTNWMHDVEVKVKGR